MKKNIKKLKRGLSQYEIELVFKKEVDDYIKIEESLLEKFKNKKVRGEWFKLTKGDINWIKQNV